MVAARDGGGDPDANANIAKLARLLGDIESFVEGRPFHDAAAPA